jgi:hypothetical protein
MYMVTVRVVRHIFIATSSASANSPSDCTSAIVTIAVIVYTVESLCSSEYLRHLCWLRTRYLADRLVSCVI